MKKTLIAILLCGAMLFTGCSLDAGGIGFKSTDMSASDPINNPPGVGDVPLEVPSGDPTEEESFASDDDNYPSKLSRSINDDESIDLNMFAGALVTYKLDYSEETNTILDQTRVVSTIESASSQVLTRLVGRYGLGYKIAGEDNYIYPYMRGLNISNYNSILGTNYTSELSLVTALSESNIMYVPVGSTTAPITANSIVSTTNSTGVSIATTVKLSIPASITNGGDTCTVNKVTIGSTDYATISADTEYVFGGNGGSFSITYNGISNPIQCVLDISKGAVSITPVVEGLNVTFAGVVKYEISYNTTGMTSPTVTLRKLPLMSASTADSSKYTLEGTSKGIYRLDMTATGSDARTFYIYIGHNNSEISLLNSQVMIKDTHYDAIRRGYTLTNETTVSCLPWRWTLDDQEYSMQEYLDAYLAKYSKPLSLAIARIQLFGDDLPETTTLVGESEIKINDLYNNAMSYELDPANEDYAGYGGYYNAFMTLVSKYLDHIGMTDYECDMISEFVLAEIVGNTIVGYDSGLFVDANANGTFDIDETYGTGEGATYDDVVLDYDYDDYSYRYNSRGGKGSIWTKISYVDTSADGYTRTQDVLSGESVKDYFKNYVNICYQTSYNLTTRGADTIVGQLFIGDFVNNMSLANDSEEDEENDESYDPYSDDEDEDDGPTFTFIPRQLKNIQSVLLVPNSNYFTNETTDNAIHVVDGLLATDDENVDIGDVLQIMVRYNKKIGDDYNLYEYCTTDLWSEDCFTISSLRQPFVNQEELKETECQTTGTGETYGFALSQTGIAPVVYFKKNALSWSAYTYNNGTYTAADIAPSASSLSGFTYDGIEFSLAEDGVLESSHYSMYKNADGYYPYLATGTETFNRYEGHGTIAGITGDFEYFELLFSRDQSVVGYNKCVKIAISISGIC